MKLYILATPIGNLKDITFRAIEILKSVDLILCEDTRTTLKLLNFYEIKKPLLIYHEHSDNKKTQKILEEIKKGKNVALLCDAGTPGISDPGGKLIESAIKEDIEIIPIPGSSALISAVSISGIPMSKFIFFGFPPSKKKRAKYFNEIKEAHYPVVFYESSHRILKALKEIKDNIPNSYVIVCRELTKKFERIYRGQIEEVLKKLEEEGPRGEFTVIVNR